MTGLSENVQTELDVRRLLLLALIDLGMVTLEYTEVCIMNLLYIFVQVGRL